METTDRSPPARGDAATDDADVPPISAYATSKERTVFTESGNGDGWIATDLTVEPEQ